MRKALGILAFVPLAAFAADDPETVYGKLHRATLAGSVEEVLSYASKGKRKEMAALAGKEDTVRMMAMSLPKTWSLTKKDVEARKAHLEFRGVHDSGPSRGSADFVKEKGAWKVEEWGWTILAQAPATTPVPQKEPAMEKPAPREPESTQPVDAPTLRRCGATPPKYNNR